MNSDSEPVGPDGPCVGRVGPSDSQPVGPDRPYVGPSDSEPVGSDGLYVGPVGLFGTLSLFDLEPVGPDGPNVGPVGPCGTLSPSDSDSVGPVGPGWMLSSILPEYCLWPCLLGYFSQWALLALLARMGRGPLLPGKDVPGLCPIGLTVVLLRVTAVPLPAVRDPMIALSPVEGLERDCAEAGEESIAVHSGWYDLDVARTPAVVAMVGMDARPTTNDDTLDCLDECAAWDSGYQCEIIDGVTVYYGLFGDLCDSDESNWDDPYDIASAEYVDQYNFDVPEGMDLIVFERCRGPYGSELLEDVGTGLTHVCQTMLRGPQGELDTVDIDPLADDFEDELYVTAAAVSPNVRGGSGVFEYGTNLNEEGDVGSSDDGLIVDRERNTWVDWCDSTFRNGLGTFPSDADGPHPMVVFPDELFSDEVWADMSVSVCEEVPVLAFKDDLISQDERTGEVSGFSLLMCNLRILHGNSDMGLSYGDTKWFCVLSSADAGGANDSDMATGLGGQSLDHWRGVIWDPGIVGQQCIRVCYDCLCLIRSGFVPRCDVISS